MADLPGLLENAKLRLRPMHAFFEGVDWRAEPRLRVLCTESLDADLAAFAGDHCPALQTRSVPRVHRTSGWNSSAHHLSAELRAALLDAYPEDRAIHGHFCGGDRRAPPLEDPP